eukprot:4642805-Amphidinium_carterae.1
MVLKEINKLLLGCNCQLMLSMKVGRAVAASSLEDTGTAATIVEPEVLAAMLDGRGMPLRHGLHKILLASKPAQSVKNV